MSLWCAQLVVLGAVSGLMSCQERATMFSFRAFRSGSRSPAQLAASCCGMAPKREGCRGAAAGDGSVAKAPRQARPVSAASSAA
eukprot:14195311-Alexandrium_andersonii.AAC.1